MYIPVATLLAARQLEAAAPASNAARDLSRAIELLSRQDTAFIPKTDSQAQKDFEAEQAASSAAAAKATACAVAASAGLPCSREVRRDLASMIATASGTARREFISSPQRRQDTSFIPKTDSQEQQDFDAEQAASSAAVANQNLCLLQASVGLPCTREVRRQDTAFIPKTDSQEQKDFEAAQAASAARAAAETACAVRASAGLPCDPVRRQDTAFIPKTDSQEQKDFDAAQAASAAAAAAQTACLVKQSAGLPCTRELAPLSRRQDTAFIPKTDSQEQKDFEAAQAASSAAAAAQTACLVRASAGLPCTREISQVRRQDTAFIPKTDSQEQKDFDAAQAASAAAAAAQTACLVRASAGLPCTREVADLMVRSLIADLD